MWSDARATEKNNENLEAVASETKPIQRRKDTAYTSNLAINCETSNPIIRISILIFVQESGPQIPELNMAV